MRAYRSLLAGAGARRLALASVLGWLGFGALSLAIVLTVQDATGSASAAGAALAGFALGSGVLAQRGRGVLDLAVDAEVHEVLELGAAEAAADEAELARGLLHALGEVALVEREAQLSVLQDVVLAGVVVSASNLIHRH